MSFVALKHLIQFVIDAHCNKETKDQVRRWDKETPYSIHPIWCATCLLHETHLPKKVRIRGYQALLLHDVIEDTPEKLPDFVSGEVKNLVLEMSFASSAEEFDKLWERSDECKLLKLYDKVSNLMDGSWMPDEKWNKYCNLVHQLIEFVEKKYGELNIVKIARAIAIRR